MADYGKVFRRVWSNPKFRRASEDCRTLTLYLLTNEHGTSEGLYRLPSAYAASDLQWTPERYEAAFAEVEEMGFIERDPDIDLVLIVNALEFNGPSNENHVKGAANAVSEIRDSPLRLRFIQQCFLYCPGLAEVLISQNGWPSDGIGTGSEPSSKAVRTPSEGHPDGIGTGSEPSSNTPPPSPPPLETPTELSSNTKSELSTDAHETGVHEWSTGELVEQLATSKAKSTRQALYDAINQARTAGHNRTTIETTGQRTPGGSGSRRDHDVAARIVALARERPNTAARAGGVEQIRNALPDQATPPPANVRAALTSSKGAA